MGHLSRSDAQGVQERGGQVVSVFSRLVRKPQPGPAPASVRPIRVVETLGSWRKAARKAARRDLESRQPPRGPTPFQWQLVAGYRASKARRLEEAAAEARAHPEELAEVERRLANRAKTQDGLQPSQLAARISLPVYLFLQALFAAVEYPLIHIAFTRLPVDDGTIKAISLLVGCVLVAGMHVL